MLSGGKYFLINESDFNPNLVAISLLFNIVNAFN